MTGQPIIKGWCPGALRPMMSGDGLVVRVRPIAGRLTQDQARSIAALSAAHGNGLIDVSSRANIQLRGVTEQTHAPLIEGLRAGGLIDADIAAESRRNIVVTPFYDEGDQTEALAIALSDALATATTLDLPGKFGFAVDCGRVPVLTDAPADIRFERDNGGQLLLRPDGSNFGRPVTAETAVPEAFDLASWFIAQRGEARRMRHLTSRQECSLPKSFDTPCQPGMVRARPGATTSGLLVAFAFGQIRSETLMALADIGALRFTPWRMVMIEEASSVADLPELITDADDSLLRVVACTGAPACSQALGETRALARSLAPLTQADETLHVSGCAKGCAHPGAADLTLTATNAGYDLIQHGRADADPVRPAMTPHQILQFLTKAR